MTERFEAEGGITFSLGPDVRPMPSMTREETTMNAHTPGPWTVRRYGKGSFEVVGPTKGGVKRTLTDLMRSESEREANARLIALAPEMAEALRALTHAVLWITDQSDAGRLDAIERLHKDGTVIEAARALLARLDEEEA